LSRREDILDGTEVGVWTRRFGLVYTCNAGWLDLGHLNPESTRAEIGAANLWRQVAAEGAPMLDPRCAPPPPLGGLLGAAHHALVKPDTCETDPLYRFSGGATGYPVRSRQDSGSLPGRPGKEGRFVIKRGLSLSEKRSVALAIFVEISLKFENLQVFAEWLGIGQSGFSQEDLVSNLIGFYIGVGEITQFAALRACHPVSAKAAYEIWDREGPVGANKNRSFTPKLAQRTGNEVRGLCQDECRLQPRKLPRVFTTIRPAIKGILFRDLPAF
jgi:hypothetical protein